MSKKTSHQPSRFRTGEQIVVRSAEEILATLDENGALDGCPFMPEMLDWCGKPFRIQRRVEKICVVDHPMRRFPTDDVVILDGPRCDGSEHDGCKHGCRILWKEAWLRPARAAHPENGSRNKGVEQLRAALKVKTDHEHYFCQSTELLKATEAFPGKQKLWTIRIVLKEIFTGELPVWEMVRLFTGWAWMRVRRAVGGRRWIRGPRERTPNDPLGLNSGERVRVKSRDQIAETLDRRGRNRGMVICYEMSRCCGMEAEVRYRVDRIIDERTGKMLTISNAVTLQNVNDRKSLTEECQCYDQLGDCPRGELMYWREVWLERVHRAGRGNASA